MESEIGQLAATFKNEYEELEAVAKELDDEYEELEAIAKKLVAALDDKCEEVEELTAELAASQAIRAELELRTERQEGLADVIAQRDAAQQDTERLRKALEEISQLSRVQSDAAMVMARQALEDVPR